MKTLLVFPIILMISISCSGQPENNQQVTNRQTSLTTFEDKQQESLVDNDQAEEEITVPQSMDFRPAARKVTPAVVHIQSTMGTREGERQNPYRNIPPQFRDFFNIPDGSTPRRGAGSGVIISSDGYIVTNNHVIDNADIVTIVLNDNRSYQAEVIGSDPTTDLALVKIDESDLPFVEFGNMDEVEVGEWVLAVGNPFNLSSTVTAGIVSATGRSINILREQAAVESFIQTDAAINPGNSGGALVNTQGKLIGINTAIASPTGSYSGYGFAVPVDLTKKVVNDLLNYGTVQRGYLGVLIRNIDAQLAEEENLDITRGVYIDSLIANSAAQDAGIRAGDVIVKIDDYAINASPQLISLIAQRRPGDEITLTVVRNGERRNYKAILRNEFGGTELLDENTATSRPPE